jgi:rhodanese-related sulfurtransferase
MLWQILAAIVVGLGLWLWWWAARGADLETIVRLVARFFPEISQISRPQFAAWLASGGPPPLLFDVRGAQEYAVSHLAGAQWLDPGTRGARLDQAAPKDAPIVVYCSVGFRACQIARRLKRAGFSHVQNLEGSLFKWANEGRPMVTSDGQPTSKVHPYSKTWQRLVLPEHRAELPVR